MIKFIDLLAVDELAYVRGACYWQGQYYADNATWQQACNSCACTAGLATCTQVWCGTGNCLAMSLRAPDAVVCTPEQVCVPSPREACLSPVCPPWGECRGFEAPRRVGPPPVPAPASCWPNQAELSNSCARLTLLLQPARLTTAVSTESLCGDLRRLTASLQSLARRQDPLVVLCDLKLGYRDTLEVTMVSQK